MKGSRRIFLIGEAGVNHNGSIESARKLVDAAARAGVDAVKFQTFDPDRLVTPKAPKALYQQKNDAERESQYEMLRRLCLTQSEQKALFDYCNSKGVLFLSSPFDLKSIDFLVSLGLDTLKIPSGEITNLPYLRKIGSMNKRIIMSTGMATMKEIGAALNVLLSCGTLKTNITLLHCTTEYPAPFENVNLKAMVAIRDAFTIAVGYSDHTRGIEAAIAAAALGASVIEKHFTLNKGLPGPDHASSLVEEELRTMVDSIRNVEKSLGSSLKKPTCAEIKNRIAIRKCIVAAVPIQKNTEFSDENLASKRPSLGLSPMNWDRIVGKKAKRNFAKDEAISL